MTHHRLIGRDAMRRSAPLFRPCDPQVQVTRRGTTGMASSFAEPLTVPSGWLNVRVAHRWKPALNTFAITFGDRLVPVNDEPPPWPVTTFPCPTRV